MWGITAEEWHKFVEEFLSAKKAQLNKHLQTYPFSKLDKKDKEYIASDIFFYEFINNGAFLGSTGNLNIIDNVLQKNNGDFRNVTLVSPIQYLVFIALGGHLAKKIKQNQQSIDSFYAGNFETGDLYYAESYKEFSIKTEELGNNYDYYFKFDFTNFFPNLNLALLFHRIQEMVPEEDPRSLMIYQNLLEFFGEGKFPVIDGNPGLSFIATRCYLNQFDNEVSKKIMNNPNILDFHIVRYVDDTYIFFSCGQIDLAKEDIQIIVQDVSESSKLNLNHMKQNFGIGNKVSDEVEQNLYDYVVNGENIEYDQYYSKKNLEDLFQNLFLLDRDASFNDIENTFINAFRSEFNFTYTEVWNWYLYEHPEYFEDMRVKNYFFKLIMNKNYLFRFYSKQFVRMLINTRNEQMIKNFLNNTFVRHRSHHLAKYQRLMMLEYLINTNFKHSDLMRVLQDESPHVYEYINEYCLGNWLTKKRDNLSVNYEKVDEFTERSKKDYVLNYQYFMAEFFSNKSMILEEFAYYKNYFDRKSSYLFAALDIDGVYKRNKNGHPISWGFTYRKDNETKELRKLDIDPDLVDGVERAYQLRNQNPVSHASAEALLREDLKTTDLKECIVAMDNVIGLLSEKVTDKYRLKNNLKF